MTTKTILAATAAFAAIIAPAFASAAPASEDANVQIAVVRTADLDLSTEQGQATLKARISGAVNHVCGPSEGMISLEERLSINACRAKARNAALAAARSHQDQVLAQR